MTLSLKVGPVIMIVLGLNKKAVNQATARQVNFKSLGRENYIFREVCRQQKTLHTRFL
jgi:hypothetical protein